MTKPVSMYQSFSNKSQFLVSSSGTSEAIADPGMIGPVTEIRLDTDALMNEFPGLETGDDLVRNSMEKLIDRDRFGVIVVKMDPFGGAEDTALSLQVAGAIDKICGREEGWWGIIDENMLACFFPGKGDRTCRRIAQTLRKRLWKASKATVSVGIAAYPKITYPKEKILGNACKALEHAAFFGPDSQVIFDDVSLNISGDNQFQKGDIGAAIEEFRTALLIEPSNVNVHNSLGVCHSLLGNFDPALSEFETALKLAPKEFMAHYNLGLVHVLTGNRQEALSHFLQAHTLSGDVYEVTLQTGRLYIETGDPEKGFSYLEKALRLNPTALAHRLMGDCQIALGHPEEAITAYKQAVKLNPNDAAALSALGHLYENKGENREIAALFCEQSVEIAPTEGIYRHRLGELYLKQDRLEDALKAFQTAIELGYDSSRFMEEIQNRLAVGEDQGCGEPASL